MPLRGKTKTNKPALEGKKDVVIPSSLMEKRRSSAPWRPNMNPYVGKRGGNQPKKRKSEKPRQTHQRIGALIAFTSSI